MTSSGASGSSKTQCSGAPNRGNRYADFVVASENCTINHDVLTDYSEDGVDLTLIRWMLSLTPNERLRFVEERINEILAIRQLNAGNQALFNPAKPL